MDNETTRIFNDSSFYMQDSTTKKYINPTESNPKPSVKKGPSTTTTAAGVGGFVAGAAVGVGATAVASNNTTEAFVDPSEVTNDTDTSNSTTTATEGAAAIPTPDQVILANDEGVRYAHVTADNFNDAFAQARAQVGAGGVFEYEGRLYGTYYADEWNEMSSQERSDYQSRVNEVAPSHQTTTNYQASAHSSFANEDNLDQNPIHTVNTNEEVIVAEPADTEIRVLGVESVQSGNGQIMNLAVVEAGGEQALMVDLDNNGFIDVLIHDDNADGSIQDSEVYDISQENIDIRDLAQIHMIQQNEIYQAADEIPTDVSSDFDSYAEV